MPSAALARDCHATRGSPARRLPTTALWLPTTRTTRGSARAPSRTTFECRADQVYRVVLPVEYRNLFRTLSFVNFEWAATVVPASKCLGPYLHRLLLRAVMDGRDRVALAEELGITLDSLRQRIHRARLALEAELER